MRWLRDEDGTIRFFAGMMAGFGAIDVGPGGWRTLLVAVASPLMVLGA